MEYTPEEQKLIESIRDLKIDFGRIQVIIYIQHGKLFRVEIEKVIESKVLTG